MNFFEKVYQVVKQIPKGKVASYGVIAFVCGNPKMSRQVGWALHCNPDNSEIPCHRVVTKQGKLSTAFAFGGMESQRQMLLQEGVKFKGDLVDMSQCAIVPSIMHIHDLGFQYGVEN
ncbi:MAG: MGMT family protein [Clostridiales bacterium]|jgi:methylated-DNA-protein-cysteine methyltransferase-like protein|nr:MGMT family protein [Clostridiales bacterium]